MNCWHLLISACALAVLWGCGQGATETMKIFHAGSLSVPFEKMEKEFEKRHPGIDVRREAYGSAMAIRQVTELGKPAEVVASADYRLIDSMMLDSKEQWAEANMLFARNAMCVAVSEEAPPLDPETWASDLAKGKTRVGFSNPNQDPCGYRSLIVLWLAAQHYPDSNIFDELVAPNSPIKAKTDDGGVTIKVPGGVKVEDPLVMRPKETDLLALLEAGAIDYLLIYRSVAVQHGLDYVSLPPEVNLSSPELAGQYGRVRVRLLDDRPEKTVVVQGSPIVYGITIPRNCRRTEDARAFIRLLTSETGQRILDECGQAPLKPPLYSDASGENTLGL